MPARLKTILFAIGMLALNLAASMIVPNMISSSIVRRGGRIWTDAAIHGAVGDAIAAFAVGYFIQWKWHPRVARWMWLVGLAWFLGAIFVDWRTHAARSILGMQGAYSIWGEFTGARCAGPTMDCLDWLIPFLIALRTACYSLGAFCCVVFHAPLSAWAASLMPQHSDDHPPPDQQESPTEP